jgi:glucose-6-phosphate isomerase
MKDLSTNVGLNVKLNDQGQLEFSGLLGGEMSKRTVADMKEVLLNQGIKDRDLYYMYRDLRLAVDEKTIRENNLRFDLTVILPGKLESEYVKTLGHYHPLKAGSEISYPEVYEVISGRAFYLLQRPKIENGIEDFSIIEEAYLVEVRAGEKAIMPPNFGHVTINIDFEPLVMANWVSGNFSSVYGDIKKLQGAGFYLLIDGKNYKIEKNNRYQPLPELITARPKSLPEFALEFGQPMYQSGIKAIEKLEYLNNPEKFIDRTRPDVIFK